MLSACHASCFVATSSPRPKLMRDRGERNRRIEMKFVKMTLMGIGGVALAVLLLTPKTAHALVAALVQVTNTTANPVPNQPRFVTRLWIRNPIYRSHTGADRLPVGGPKCLRNPISDHWGCG